MGSFLKLSAKHIALLPKLLEARLPESCMLHNVVKLYLDNRFSKNVRTEFFAYEGKVDDIDTSYIVGYQHRSLCSDISIITSEGEMKSVTKEVVKSLEQLFDWNMPLTIHTTSIPRVHDLVRTQRGEITFYEICFAFQIPIEDALELELRLPEEVVAKELSPEQAERICKTWRFSMGGTPGNMSDSILTVGSFGLCIENECIGYVVNSTNGNFYALYVKPDFRGKGIGELVATGMAKQAAMQGLIPNANVPLDNRVLFNLFEKVGFYCSHAVEQIKYRPKKVVKRSK